MFHRWVGALVGLAMMGMAGSANAFSIFTDRNVWEAAITGSITTDTFSNPISPALSITLDSGIISTQTGAGAVSNQVTTGVFQGFVNQLGPSGLELTWTFPEPIFAFGGDYGLLNVPFGLTVTGDFDGTGLQTISIASTLGSGSGFFGLVGADSFSSLIWRSNDGAGTFSGEFYTVDNFSFVPEPSTLALFGIGLAGLGFMTRRRKRRQPVQAALVLGGGRDV